MELKNQNKTKKSLNRKPQRRHKSCNLIPGTRMEHVYLNKQQKYSDEKDSSRMAATFYRAHTNN